MPPMLRNNINISVSFVDKSIEGERCFYDSQVNGIKYEKLIFSSQHIALLQTKSLQLRHFNTAHKPINGAINAEPHSSGKRWDFRRIHCSSPYPQSKDNFVQSTIQIDIVLEDGQRLPLLTAITPAFIVKGRAPSCSRPKSHIIQIDQAIDKPTLEDYDKNKMISQISQIE